MFYVDTYKCIAYFSYEISKINQRNQFWGKSVGFNMKSPNFILKKSTVRS